MRTFTHDNPNDTLLFRDESGNIVLTFDLSGDVERHTFGNNQDELFDMMCDYFDEGKHTDIFDELTLNAQDALWNALYWLNERNVEV